MERQSTRKLFKLVIALVALFTLALSVFAFGACGGEEHKHVYESSGKTAANCGTIGVETFTCSCGDTYVAVTPATGDHKWDASGKYCETCGLPNFGADGIDYSKIPDSFTAEDLDAIKAAITASKGELTTEQKAAHDALGEKVDGVQGSVGDLQGSVDDLQQAVSDLNTHPVHNLVAQTPIEIAGTCTSYGFTITLSECSTCHATFLTKIERSAALGHESDGGKVAVEPTCQLFGSWQETCTKCGAVLNERTLNTVPHEVDLTKLSDKSIPATCTEDGTDMYGCQWCGQVMPEYNRTAKALGHTYEAPDFVVPHVNDCTTDEQVTVTCERCEEGTEGHTAVLTALAGQHSFVQEGDLEIVDCTDAEHGAIKHEKCSVCGAVQDTNVPANGQHPAHDKASEIVIYIPLKPVDKWAEFKAKNNAQDPANLNEGSDGYKESNNVVKYTYYVCATCGLSVQVGAVAETHTFALDPESLLGTTHSAVNGVPQQECLDYTVTYRCTDTNCLAAYDSVVEGHGHNWSAPAWDENTGKGQVSAGWLVKADAEGKLLNATCTAEGVAYRYCTDCNAQHKTDAVDAKGVATYEEHAISKIDHQLTGWTDRLLPTCTEDGWVEGPCAFCGGTVRETLEATGHTYGEWKRVYGTNGDDECQSAHEARYCINGDCDDVQYREAASRYDHQWRLEVVTPNTCTKDGWGRDVCDRCGDAGTYHPIPASHAFTFDTTGLSDDQIKAILEKFVKPVWEKAYKPYATESFWTESIGPWLATAHNSNTITISMGVSATCERNGGIYHICLRCGLLEIENETPLANHVWKLDPAKQTVPATCTSTGTEYYVCSVCGETKTKTLEKLPHTWQLYLYDCTDSTNQSGYSGYYCTVCNAGYGKNNRADGLAKYYQGEGFITLEKGAELGLEAPVYHEGHAYRYANFTQGTLCGSDASYTIECDHCQMFQDDGGPLKNGTFTLTKDYFEANKKSEGWGEFLDFLFKTEGTEYEHRDGAVYRPDHTQATTPEAGKTVYTLKQFVPTAQWNAIEGVVNDGSNAHNVMVDEYYGCSVCGANSDVTKFHEVYTQKHNMTVLWKEELSDPSIPANVLNYKESACSYYDIDFYGGWYDSNIEGVETTSYAALNVHKDVNVVFYCTDDGCRGGIVSEHLYKWDGKHTFTAKDWDETWTYEDATSEENGWKIVEADKNITPDCQTSVRVQRTCTLDGCGYTETETVFGAHKLGRWTYTEATCTRPYTKTAGCTVCHKVVTEEVGKPNGHTWKYDVDDKSTWDLVFDEEGRLEQQFPCRSTKVKNVCTVCGEEWIETIPPVTEHTWSTNVVTEKEPTCTTPGYGYVVCIYCGETRNVSIDALGHNWGTEITFHDPTCVEDGFNAHTCLRCGALATPEDGIEHYVFRPATGVHTWETDENGDVVVYEDTPASCTAGGTYAYKCTVCGQLYVQGTTEPKGHSYHWIQTLIVANCLHGGQELFECEYCGDRYTQDTDKSEHFIVVRTGYMIPGDPNIYDETPRGDGAVLIYTPDGQDWTDEERFELWNKAIDVLAATPCLVKKVTAEICWAGNEIISVLSVTNAADHNMQLTKNLTPATCTEYGMDLYTCSYCGVTAYTDVAPLGHSWTRPEGEPVEGTDYKYVEIPATCESEGKIYWQCNDCDAQIFVGTTEKLGHWYYVDKNGKPLSKEDAAKLTPEQKRAHLNFVEQDESASSCLAADYKVVECVNCHVRYAWSVDNKAQGHTWKPIVSTEKNGTCMEYDYSANIWYCEKCGLVADMGKVETEPDEMRATYLKATGALADFHDSYGNLLVKAETFEKPEQAADEEATKSYYSVDDIIDAIVKAYQSDEMNEHDFTIHKNEDGSAWNVLKLSGGDCTTASLQIVLCAKCGVTATVPAQNADAFKTEGQKDGKDVYASFKLDTPEFFSYLLNKSYTLGTSYEGFATEKKDGGLGYVELTQFGVKNESLELKNENKDKTDPEDPAWKFRNTWHDAYAEFAETLGLADMISSVDWSKWNSGVQVLTAKGITDIWLNVYYYFNFARAQFTTTGHKFVNNNALADCQMDPFLTILFEDWVGTYVNLDALILRKDVQNKEKAYITAAAQKDLGIDPKDYYTVDEQQVKHWLTIAGLKPEGGEWTDDAKATDWFKTEGDFSKYEKVIDVLAAIPQSELDAAIKAVISDIGTALDAGDTWRGAYLGINDFCLNACTIDGETVDTFGGFVLTTEHDRQYKIYKLDPVTGKKTGDLYDTVLTMDPDWTLPADPETAPEGWDKTLQFIQYLFENKANKDQLPEWVQAYYEDETYAPMIEYVLKKVGGEDVITCLVCRVCKNCNDKLDNNTHVDPDENDLLNSANCQHGNLCVACHEPLSAETATHKLVSPAELPESLQRAYAALCNEWEAVFTTVEKTCYSAHVVKVCVGCLEAWYNDSVNSTSTWKKPAESVGQTEEPAKSGWVKDVNYEIDEKTEAHVFKLEEVPEKILAKLPAATEEDPDAGTKTAILRLFGTPDEKGDVKVGENVILSFTDAGELLLTYKGTPAPGYCTGDEYTQHICITCAIALGGFGEKVNPADLGIADVVVKTPAAEGVEATYEWKFRNNYGVESADDDALTVSDIKTEAKPGNVQSNTEKGWIDDTTTHAALKHVYAPMKGGKVTYNDEGCSLTLVCLRCAMNDKEQKYIGTMKKAQADSDAHIFLLAKSADDITNSTELPVPDADNLKKVFDTYADPITYTIGGSAELGTNQGAAESGYYTLGGASEKSVELANGLTVAADKNVVIEIAEGTTVTAGNAVTVQDGGSLTIKGGELSAEAGLTTKGAANLTLENVTFKSTSARLTFGIVGTGGTEEDVENVVFTIKDSVIVTGGLTGIWVNGNLDGATLNIENSVVVGQESALSVGGDTTVNATNCTFAGGSAAVVLNSGNSTFTNCTFIGANNNNGENLAWDGNAYPNVMNAILVVAAKGGNYDNVAVTLSGNKFVKADKTTGITSESEELTEIAQGTLKSGYFYKAAEEEDADAANEVSLAVWVNGEINFTTDTAMTLKLGVNVFTFGDDGKTATTPTEATGLTRITVSGTTITK